MYPADCRTYIVSRSGGGPVSCPPEDLARAGLPVCGQGLVVETRLGVLLRVLVVVVSSTTSSNAGSNLKSGKN